MDSTDITNHKRATCSGPTRRSGLSSRTPEQLYGPRWQTKLREVQTLLPKKEAELAGARDPDHRERVSRELGRLRSKAQWMESTIIEIVISEAQNEVRDFRRWEFDIIPHRVVMKTGFETPDGKRVLFCDQHPPFAIETVERIAPGKWAKPIVRGHGERPDLSPDGRTIVFRMGDGDVAVLDADGGTPRIIAHVPGRAFDQPRYAFDGRTIYAKSHDADATTSIWAIGSAGHRRRSRLRFMTSSVSGN